LTGSNHLYVYDQHYKIFFPHDFFSIDNDFADVYEKYQRRIRRFYNILEQRKKIEFVWQYYDDDNPLKELESITELKFNNMNAIWPQIYQYIHETYPYKEIDILISSSNEWGKLK
jgi:uncharacterized protein YlbG (UPF0298 family)